MLYSIPRISIIEVWLMVMQKQGKVIFKGLTSFSDVYRKVDAKLLIMRSTQTKGLSPKRLFLNLFMVVNPLRPYSDVSQTSHCDINGLSVSEVMRIENMITQMKLS